MQPPNFNKDGAFGAIYERIVAEVAAEHLWPSSYVVCCSTFSDLDFMAVLASATPGEPGKLVGCLEVKARRVLSTRYVSTIISERKVIAARALRAYLKAPSHCAILFTDTLALFSLALPADAVELIGRPDRGGTGVPHAVYAHSRLTFYPTLFEEVTRRVAAEAA